MASPLTSYLDVAGGMGTTGYRAFLSLSMQQREEPANRPAPPSHVPSLKGETGPDQPPTPQRNVLARRILSQATTVFLLLVLCFLVMIGYGIVNNRWYHVLTVNGGFMQPTIDWGDLIVITKPPQELKPGMIVTMQVKDKIVTHRVLQVDPLVTQGDANGVPDSWDPDDVKVVGVVRFWIPKMGRLLDGLRLTGSGSDAWFRDSKQMPCALSAGQGETAEPEARETAAGPEDISAEPRASDSDAEPAPNVDEPPTTEPSSATTTPALVTESTEPVLEAVPPTGE